MATVDGSEIMYQLRFIPIIYKVFYICKVVGNRISEASTVGPMANAIFIYTFTPSFPL